MRSTGRDIVGTGNVTGTVIAIVLRFLSGRKLPCLLYRPILRQLAFAEVEKLRRATDAPKPQQMLYLTAWRPHRNSAPPVANLSSFVYSFSCCSFHVAHVVRDCS